jgi:hypothetical protein
VRFLSNGSDTKVLVYYSNKPQDASTWETLSFSDMQDSNMAISLDDFFSFTNGRIEGWDNVMGYVNQDI